MTLVKLHWIDEEKRAQRFQRLAGQGAACLFLGLVCNFDMHYSQAILSKLFSLSPFGYLVCIFLQQEVNRVLIAEQVHSRIFAKACQHHEIRKA